MNRDIFIELEKQLEAAERKVKSLKKAIETLQTLCQHDFQFLCHGHNGDIDECTICKLKKQ